MNVTTNTLEPRQRSTTEIKRLIDEAARAASQGKEVTIEDFPAIPESWSALGGECKRVHRLLSDLLTNFGHQPYMSAREIDLTLVILAKWDTLRIRLEDRMDKAIDDGVSDKEFLSVFF